MAIGQSAGKSYAYLFGVYLGDGCVTTMGTQTVFRLNTIDQDFATAVEAAFWAIGARAVNCCTHAVAKSSKPNHSLTARHDDACREFVDRSHGKLVFPDFIWSAARAERLAFVAGLMDSEGFVARHSLRAKPTEAHWQLTNRSYYMGFKSCDEWVPAFARLLETLGVQHGKIGIEEPRQLGYKTPRRFTVKMQSWIDAGCYFNIARKQDRVHEWASAPAYAHRRVAPRRLTSETSRSTLEQSGR